MGITQTTLDNIKGASLGVFDTATHIGVGTSNQAESALDTNLIGPVIRKAFDEAKIKNIPSGIYDFSATIGLTEANGNTLRETGLFDAASAGNMFVRKLLNADVVKISTLELSIGIRVTVTVTNV